MLHLFYIDLNFFASKKMPRANNSYSNNHHDALHKFSVLNRKIAIITTAGSARLIRRTVNGCVILANVHWTVAIALGLSVYVFIVASDGGGEGN